MPTTSNDRTMTKVITVTEGLLRIELVENK